MGMRIIQDVIYNEHTALFCFYLVFLHVVGSLWIYVTHLTYLT